MPVEPSPSRFDLPDPATADGDVVAVGGDLAAGTILQAYRKGMFPMHLEDGHLGWWSPIERAVILLHGLRVTRSLRQSTRRYRVSVDQDFRGVIAGCADPSRPESWITPEIIDAYTELHELGWVHSVEVWDQGRNLVGGLYGVALGGLFAGESMFHVTRDASKVALVHLVVTMNRAGDGLIDVQWLTSHLESLGAVVIGKEAYLERLPTLLAMRDAFSQPMPGDSG